MYHLNLAFWLSPHDECRAGVVEALMWVLLTPLPLLLCFLPLAKRTLPVYAQLACLQGGVRGRTRFSRCAQIVIAHLINVYLFHN